MPLSPFWCPPRRARASTGWPLHPLPWPTFNSIALGILRLSLAIFLHHAAPTVARPPTAPPSLTPTCSTLPARPSSVFQVSKKSCRAPWVPPRKKCTFTACLHKERERNRELALTTRCSSVDVLVIGAGPTGLGAAKRLNQIVRLLPPPPWHAACPAAHVN